MSKNGNKFLESKKLSLDQKTTASTFKAAALRSHKRPIKNQTVDSIPVDVPYKRTVREDTT